MEKRGPITAGTAGHRLKSQIENEYEKSRQTYGSPRITRALRNGGEAGGNRVARLMRTAGLQGRQKRRYRVRTTDSRHGQSIAPNHLAVAQTPTSPTRFGRLTSPTSRRAQAAFNLNPAVEG